MTSWRFYEIGNISCDEVGNSSDHIVPRNDSDQFEEYNTPVNALQKPLHDLESCGNHTGSREPSTKTTLWKKKEPISHFPMIEESFTILEGSQFQESENIVLASCPQFIARASSALASQGNRSSGECVENRNGNTDNIIFHARDPVLSNAVSFNDNKSFHLSVDEVPQTIADLGILENENDDRENAFMYYDLPDIGNLEDTDSMLRNWDATFVQGASSTGEELSWFSSSNTLYGSEVTFETGTFETGLQSSTSAFSGLNNNTSRHSVDINFLPKRDQSRENSDKLSSHCYQSYDTCLYTEAKSNGEFTPSKVCGAGDMIKVSSISHNNGENDPTGCEDADLINVHLKKIESQYVSEENKIQQYKDQEHIFPAFPSQSYSSQGSSMKKFSGSTFQGHAQTLNLHPQLGVDQPTHQVPFQQLTSIIKFGNDGNPSSSYNSPMDATNHVPYCIERSVDQMHKPPTMTSKENLEKNPKKHQSCVITEQMHQQTGFKNKELIQKMNVRYGQEIKANGNIGCISLEAAAKIDSPIVLESSCMTSVCPDDFSLEVTSFHQLKDVTDQLDIRTKLCIRDSLYRLARSAKQRHDFSGISNYSKTSKDAEGLQGTEPQKNICAEFVDAETDTNPIDRFVAHLLFTGLQDPSPRSI